MPSLSESERQALLNLARQAVTEAVSRGHRYADKAKKVMFNPVGQIVGRMNTVRPVKEVIYQLVEEYLEAVERIQRLSANAAG